MPNIKSSKKRMIQSEKRRKRNSSQRSMMKTFIKKISKAIKSGDKKIANSFLCKTQSVLDKLANKNLIHKNKSSRYKSKLMIQINNMKKSNTK